MVLQTNRRQSVSQQIDRTTCTWCGSASCLELRTRVTKVSGATARRTQYLVAAQREKLLANILYKASSPFVLFKTPCLPTRKAALNGVDTCCRTILVTAHAKDEADDSCPSASAEACRCASRIALLTGSALPALSSLDTFRTKLIMRMDAIYSSA